MKSVAGARGTLAVALLLVSTIAGAQTWKPPAESARCPSKWGAGDERGSANHMTPALVLNAARLIRTGDVIELGRVLRAGMPIQATRRFDLHTKRTFMNPQSNQRGSNEEVVTTELGQVGTQFDGFAHQSHGDSLYNCFKISDTSTRTGFTKLGIENVGTLMTRGVLIDVAGLKGVDTLPDAYEITVQDVQQALQKHNLTLRPGDAVLIHTGWGQAVGKGQRALHEVRPWHWGRRRRMARDPGPAAGRRGQRPGGSLAESRRADLAPGPPDHARRARHPSAGEPEARRAGGQGRPRVRVRDAAAQDPGRHGLDGRAGRDPLTRGTDGVTRRSEER